MRLNKVCSLIQNILSDCFRGCVWGAHPFKSELTKYRKKNNLIYGFCCSLPKFMQHGRPSKERQTLQSIRLSFCTWLHVFINNYTFNNAYAPQVYVVDLLDASIHNNKLCYLELQHVSEQNGSCRLRILSVHWSLCYGNFQMLYACKKCFNTICCRLFVFSEYMITVTDWQVLHTLAVTRWKSIHLNCRRSQVRYPTSKYLPGARQ